jgi:hypothetical protein
VCAVRRSADAASARWVGAARLRPAPSARARARVLRWRSGKGRRRTNRQPCRKPECRDGATRSQPERAHKSRSPGRGRCNERRTGAG